MLETPIAPRCSEAWRLAVTLAGLVLLGWGMGVIVVHVFGGFFHSAVDRPVNRWVHGHHAALVTTVMRRVSPLGSAPVALVVALVAGAGLAVRRRSRAALVTLVLAYAGGSSVAFVVKLAVRRGQPEVPGGLGGITQLAFPSGHATLAAAVYGTLALLVLVGGIRGGRWLPAATGLMLVALVLAIGVSRVYLGLHDPTDVLAGWALGGLWAVAVTRRAS